MWSVVPCCLRRGIACGAITPTFHWSFVPIDSLLKGSWSNACFEKLAYRNFSYVFPLLEFLEVNCLRVGVGGTVISISCNPRLKYFCVVGGTELKRIEIFLAPSLETFKYISGNPCAINLDTCTALKHLYLKDVYLSAHHLPLHNLLSKLLCIESLELYNCEAVGQIKITSSCLKKLVLTYYSSFPGAIIDTPNLLDLVFGACNSDFKFSSWNVPKLEKVHMRFSVKSFSSVCKAGLEEFLMKLHNYESLKLFIESYCDGDGKGRNRILHEKLLAIPFSSLNKFLIKGRPSDFAVISSRREEYFFTEEEFCGRLPVRLSLIFSSRQSIELMYKNVIKACPKWRYQLVSTEEIEHEMDSEWKSFINTHSNGYHTATIIIDVNPVRGTVGRRIGRGWDLDGLDSFTKNRP